MVSDRTESPQSPQKRRNRALCIPEAAITARKQAFYDNSHNAARGLQLPECTGRAAVNPVVAPGLASLVPLLLPGPNCCSCFHPLCPKLTSAVLSNSCNYALSPPSFITQITSAAQKVIPDRVLFVNLQRTPHSVKSLPLKGDPGVHFIFPLALILSWHLKND